jgi:hypothetical protein
MSSMKPPDLIRHGPFVLFHYLVFIPAPIIVYLIIYYFQHKQLTAGLWKAIKGQN